MYIYICIYTYISCNQPKKHGKFTIHGWSVRVFSDILQMSDFLRCYSRFDDAWCKVGLENLTPKAGTSRNEKKGAFRGENHRSKTGVGIDVPVEGF